MMKTLTLAEVYNTACYVIEMHFKVIQTSILIEGFF